MRAAGLVVGSTIPLDPELAEYIANLTGTTDELEDYDAGRAIRRWFAMTEEDGARH